MVTEKSCGGVVFRRLNGIDYLLIKHKEKDGGHWFFPKGHVKEGESEEETALREIYEEIGLKVKILENFRETYPYFDNINNVDKVVVFFLCESESSEVNQCPVEVEECAWLNFKDALERLTHKNSKEVLKKADSFLNN